MQAYTLSTLASPSKVKHAYPSISVRITIQIFVCILASEEAAVNSDKFPPRYLAIVSGYKNLIIRSKL